MVADVVWESDGEAAPLRHAPAPASDEEAICSDGEAPVAWAPLADGGGADVPAALRQLNGLLPTAHYRQQEQQHAPGCGPGAGRGFTRSAAAPCPVAAAGRAGTFRRPMKTAAAAAAERAAAERAAKEEAELKAVLAASSGVEQAAEQAAAARPSQRLAAQPSQQLHAAGQHASFLNRRVLPQAPNRTEEMRRQLGRSMSAGAAAEAGGEAAADEPQWPAQPHQEVQEPPPPPPPQQQPTAQVQAPHRQQHLPSAARPGARLAPAAAAAAAPPAATYHRTADGLNVVYLNRHAQQTQQEVGGGARGGKAKENVNSGWGNNFVKIDMKVGGVGWVRGVSNCWVCRSSLLSSFATPPWPPPPAEGARQHQVQHQARRQEAQAVWRQGRQQVAE